jgi:hypothetical protein
MGYDMFTEAGPDDAERAATEKARARIDELSKKQNGYRTGEDNKAWDAAWEDYYRARRSYFRLNIWGMGECRELMIKFGMLTDEPGTAFPTLDAYELIEFPDDPEHFEGRARAEIIKNQTDAERAYLAAIKATTDADEGGPGIPAYKFSSNDGWLVTPRQIDAALALYRAAPDDDKKSAAAEHPWWPEWIAFLAHAKGRGGFRVY